MPTTYTQAQYSTESARQMIRDKFLPVRGADGYSDRDIEGAARYMSKTLRIGPIADCRRLVRDAIAQH